MLGGELPICVENSHTSLPNSSPNERDDVETPACKVSELGFTMDLERYIIEFFAMTHFYHVEL